MNYGNRTETIVCLNQLADIAFCLFTKIIFDLFLFDIEDHRSLREGNNNSRRDVESASKRKARQSPITNCFKGTKTVQGNDAKRAKTGDTGKYTQFIDLSLRPYSISYSSSEFIPIAPRHSKQETLEQCAFNIKKYSFANTDNATRAFNGKLNLDRAFSDLQDPTFKI